MSPPPPHPARPAPLPPLQGRRGGARAQGARLREGRAHPRRAQRRAWRRSTARAAPPSPACWSTASRSTARGRSWRSSRSSLPEPPLFPEPIADAVREAERWGDEELQDLGRRLPLGRLHFRPEAMGTFGGARPARPGRHRLRDQVRARVLEVPRDHAPTGSPRTWPACRRSSTTSTRSPTTASSAATSRTPRTSRSARPSASCSPSATCGRCSRTAPASEIAMRWFPDYPGEVPAGAFPAGWVPER